MGGIHSSTSGFVRGEKNYVIQEVNVVYETLAYFHDVLVMFTYTLQPCAL